MKKFKDIFILPVILSLFEGQTNVTTDAGLSGSALSIRVSQ